MAGKQNNSRPCVLGVDLGTSGCKVCALGASGEVLGEGVAGYPTLTPQPMWAEQDADAWLPAVAAASRQAVQAVRRAGGLVVGVSLTSAAHIGVLLDARDRPVRPAILWNDQRSVDQVRSIERRAGERVLQQSCQAVSTTWTLPHLAWVRDREPKVWKRVRSVLLSKDYVLHWMTGRRCTDRGTAVSSQMWDVSTGRWSPELCDLVGLSPEQFPEVCDASMTAGMLRAQAAEAMGLPAGVPVIIGTLDSATEMLAAGVTSPGQAMIRLATAGGLQWVVPRAIPDRRLITYPMPTGSHWYRQAATNTCAAAVEWGRAMLSGTGQLSFAAFDRLAEKAVPGCGGLVFHPYLAGERAPHWNPQLRAGFHGLTLAHGPAEMARAIYEGTAISIREAMGLMPARHRSRTEPLAVVGGGTRSRIWTQILADVLGRPLRRIPEAHSAKGAALLGLGALVTTEEHRMDKRNIPSPPPRHTQDPANNKLVRPNAVRSALYARQAKRFAELRDRLSEVRPGHTDR